MKKVFLLLFVLLTLSTNAFAYWLLVRAFYWPDPYTPIPLNAKIYIDNVYSGFDTPHIFEPYSGGTYTVQLAPYTSWVPVSAYVEEIPSNGVVDFGTFENPVPVTLSYFSATITVNNLISLHWTSQSESNLMGYHVLRSVINDLGTASIVSPMIPATNTSEAQNYSFTDLDLYQEATYYYWLLSTDYDGTTRYHGPVSMDYTYSTEQTPDIPLQTGLSQIYPNPFNPVAYIPYSLSEAANVDLLIYNGRGQLVRQFDRVSREKGNYKVIWDGKDNNGRELNTGVYFFRMTAGKEVFTRKAVLLK